MAHPDCPAIPACMLAGGHDGPHRPRTNPTPVLLPADVTVEELRARLWNLVAEWNRRSDYLTNVAASLPRPADRARMQADAARLVTSARELETVLR